MGDMESEFLSDQTIENQDLCLKSPEIPDLTVCGESSKKEIVEPSLGPTTPDADKENGDFPLDLTSPLTMATELPAVLIFASQTNRNLDILSLVNDSSSPKTPKDGVFDPFAPGPDDKLLAPQGKKYFDEARTSVARQLTFGNSFKGFGCSPPSDDVGSLSDERMLESVYENLLEVIVSNQTKSVLAELSNAEQNLGPFETPPQLNRFADTCPGAPMKPIGKLRSIDLGLCRKLDF